MTNNLFLLPCSSVNVVIEFFFFPVKWIYDTDACPDKKDWLQPMLEMVKKKRVIPDLRWGNDILKAEDKLDSYYGWFKRIIIFTSSENTIADFHGGFYPKPTCEQVKT